MLIPERAERHSDRDPYGEAGRELMERRTDRRADSGTERDGQAEPFSVHFLDSDLKAMRVGALRTVNDCENVFASSDVHAHSSRRASAGFPPAS